MHNKKVAYIGEFPPPFGGVTVKNKLIYEWISSGSVYNAEMVDLMRCRSNPALLIYMIVKILRAFANKSTIVYGFGSMKRLAVVVTLQSLFKGSFKNTVIIGMGGRFSEKLLENPILKRYLIKAKCILVETGSMKDVLEEHSFCNVEVFPNPKSDEGSCMPRKRDIKEPLRLVYFSQISEEKGILDVMELIRMLNSCEKKIHFRADFYGHIKDDIKEKFELFLKENDNVFYGGVFDSGRSDVYRKLNEYDILLFPSQWKGEGVPGILVEAKMAGLAVIASDIAYNEEIIREGHEEGIIIHEEYPETMAHYINMLWNDAEYLMRLKENSSRSKERYVLSNYEELLRKVL